MLRLGILGAARIAPTALVAPARGLPDVSVSAVAARELARAQRFAAKHGIPKAYGSYVELLRDPNVDAVYNPLPNGLHCEWTLAALAAGKHVLCEKPFCSNADEALQMVEAAETTGLVLMEAFHYRYHPLMDRVAELIRELGPIETIDARMCIPLPLFGDIRFQYALGGGASMDVGAYTANMLRFAAAASGEAALQTNPNVVAARATLLRPEVDRLMEAELRFDNGTRGFIRNSMWSRHVLALRLRVEGPRGFVHVLNPVVPHLFHRLTWRVDAGRHRERVPGKATYTYQLEEFANRVGGAEPRISLQDSVGTMQLIDAIYRAAGLSVRGTRKG